MCFAVPGGPSRDRSTIGLPVMIPAQIRSFRGIFVADARAVLSDVLNDLRYSARSLLRMPAWTVTLILTIALGIGSSASVQGFVRGLMSSRMPIAGIDRLVSVFAIDESGNARPVPPADVATLAARTDLFEVLAAVRETHQRVSIGARQSLMAVAEFTPALTGLLPLPALDGVALSMRVRSVAFDPKVDPRGSELIVGGRTARVAGTLPDWLEGLYRGQPIDLWVPAIDAPPAGDVWLLGRLREGVSAADAHAALQNDGAGPALAVLPYTGLTPDAAAGMLRIGTLLSVTANAVFIIACANVAAFLLSRSSARARETAVRVAIGARRRQLARQLLVDSLLITAIGGAAGVVLAAWMADIVPLLFFDQDAEHLVFAPDTIGIVITSLACMAITVGCGLAPLLETRHDDPSVVLQREALGPSRAITRLSGALVLVQMMGCTLLVISTGLLLQGFRAAVQTSAGQRVGDPVLATGETLYRTTRAEVTELGLAYFADLENAARSVTDVSSTVWFARLPGARAAWQQVQFDRPTVSWRDARMDVTLLTPPVVESISLPPVAGRLYSATDARPCGGVVINEEAARAFFDGDPVGRTIVTEGGKAAEVIGIVADDTAAPTLYEYPDRLAPVTTPGHWTFRTPVGGDLETGLIDVNVVSSNYFSAMGFTRLDGELFDAATGGCRIGVVNEEAASTFFGGKAVGGAVIDTYGRRTVIVGVVRSALLRAQQRQVEPTLYLPMWQDVLQRMSVLLDTPSASAVMVNRIRAQMAQVPNGRPDRLQVRSLDDHLSATALAPERIAAVLVGAFAIIALALGILGLYGVMADAARRRQREFAVRLALGAQGWRVVRQLMGEGMRLVTAGVAAGMIASLLVARWLATITPGAGTPSLPVLLAAPLLLAVAVVIASVVPARRTLSVDLLTIMRDL
jgi:ABC-type antimicrobial peptide transport system permease subunit